MSKFFGDKADKEKMDKFKQGVGGSGLYFNAAEIDEKGVKLRIIPWLFEEEVEEFIPHYEGWEDRVTEENRKTVHKNIPRRFTLDDDIPDGINWKMNKSTFTGAMEASVPKEAIAFLAYVYSDKKIKLGGFTQATICKAFMAMKDSESQMYCPDLTKVDIIITRKADNKGFTVTFAPQSNPELPAEALSALEAGYIFSWSEYMAGGDPFKENEGNVWKEVQESMGVKPKKQVVNKTTTTKEATKGDADELKAWRSVKTSSGKYLGNFSLPELQSLKLKAEDQDKTNLPVYQFLVYGINHFEEKEDTIEL